MRESWKVLRLGDLCSIELGRTPSRGNASLWDAKRETGNVWLSIADLLQSEGNVVSDSKEYISDKGVLGSKVVRKGTLLVSFKLTLGRLAFAGCDLYTNEAIAALTIFNERLLSKEYLFYFLHFFDWNKAAEGDEKIKGKTLNKAKLKEMLVLVPPLAEQKRIVAILDEAFAGIAAATANAEKNLANARELFSSYVSSIFSSQGGDWIERPLGEICENLDSRRIPITKSDRTEGDIPYYGASGIVDYVAEHIFDEDILLISEDGANLLARTYPIAFSVSGKCWVNNHAHVVRFSSMTTQRMVEFYLNSISLAPYVSGMAQPKLNQKAMNSIIVPLPPPKDHARIVGQIEMIQAESKRLEDNYGQKLATLNELRQTILQKAFSGELTALSDKPLQEEAA